MSDKEIRWTKTIYDYRVSRWRKLDEGGKYTAMLFTIAWFSWT